MLGTSGIALPEGSSETLSWPVDPAVDLGILTELVDQAGQHRRLELLDIAKQKRPSHFSNLKRADGSAQSKCIFISYVFPIRNLMLGYVRVGLRVKVDIDAAVWNGDLPILVTRA